MKPKKSWKTTLAGVAGFVALLAAALQAQFDGDPATVAQWTVVAAGAAAMVACFFARDNDVTSEDAGAKPGA